MLIYLYCVTNKAPELKEIENLVDRLYFVEHQGLYAVVSKVKESEFDEANLKKNLTDFEWVRAKASIHEKAIEGVMKNACVIPFKFGTIFKTEDNLKTMLEEHLQDFQENLKNLEDKEEWGLKLYCDMEKLKSAIGQEEAEILKMEKEINSSSSGKAYLLKKKKEKLLDIVVNKKLNKFSQDSFERLSKHSIQTRINKLLPKEVTERKDDMVLNAAFLVDKEEVGSFIRVTELLTTTYGESGLFFDCTGPWPPYNFCNLSKEKPQNG